MTILGLHVANQRRALLWSDTETYIGDQPVGFRAKVAINRVARIAIVAGGNGLLAEEAHSIVTAAVDFDLLVDELPGRLRRNRADALEERRSTACVVVLAGVSRRYRRVIGYVFREGDGYAAERTDAFASPAIDGLECEHPTDLADVYGTAQQQLAVFRRGVPAATGGTLMGAVVTPEGVALHRVADLASGRLLRRENSTNSEVI